MEQGKRTVIFTDIIRRGKQRMTQSDLDLMDKTARQIGAKTLVETGSMDGCSSMLLGFVAKDNGGRLFCIEPKPTACWKTNIAELGLTENVRLIRVLSRWVELPGVEKGGIDYLFIDGDHRTRWAIVDYHYFFPFVRVGGMIAFHDYNARKGVAAWVRRAIDIILEDDKEKIEEVCHNDTRDRGIIIFRKVSE